MDIPDNRTCVAKVSKQTEVAQRTIECVFTLEHAMAYKPGQYVWIVLPQLLKPDPRGERRAFSITSIPNDTNQLSILFRASGSGYKKTLMSLTPGDEVTVAGPFGCSFCQPADESTPLVLISGGVGIAPFLSLIRHHKKTKSTRHVFLITTYASQDLEVYKTELEEYSQNGTLAGYIPLNRRLTWADVEHIPALGDGRVFISGPQGFVTSVYEELSTHGVFEHQFRFEQFYPEKEIRNEIRTIFRDGQSSSRAKQPKHIQEQSRIIFNLVNASSGHIIVTDPEGIVVFANQAAEKITGYTFQEMQGNTPRLWGGLMQEGFYKELWRTKTIHQPINTEIINRRKNGDVYYAAAHISPLLNDAKEVIGFIGSEEDITLIKKSEQSARENEERFKSLTEKISEVYWITELVPAERVVYVSPMFTTVWGIARETLYDNPKVWTDSIHPDDKQRVASAFTAFIRKEGVYDIEYRVIKKDGSIVYIHDTGELVLDQTGAVKRVVGVARDITHEIQLNKMKDEFLSIASHELRTPLTAIDGLVSMILEGEYGQVSDGLKQPLADINGASTRLIHLVNDLLNVSRIQAGRLKFTLTEFDIKPVIEEIVELLAVVAKEKGLTVKTVELLPATVQADLDKVKQILNNLIGNSIKFTDHGGITVTTKQDSEVLKVMVQDTGIGIQEEDKKMLFEKFKQLDSGNNRPPGTGLGLFISKELSRKMGGDLTLLSSEPNKGSVFMCTLPLAGSVQADNISAAIALEAKQNPDQKSDTITKI